MERSRLVFIFFFFYIIVISIGSIKCIDNNNLVTNQSALFVFGDSVFDAGNNNYIATLPSFRSNYWPYGQTTFKFPTGRASNGRLIPDFIGNSTTLFRYFISRQVLTETVCWRGSGVCMVTVDPAKSTTK